MQTFTVVIERDPESGWLVGEVVELRGCHTQAPNLPSLEKNIREAIRSYLRVRGILDCVGEPKLEIFYKLNECEEPMLPPTENLNRNDSKPSTEILLAEHARIRSLYEYNVKTGEQLVTLYIAVVSAIAALVAGIREIVPKSEGLIMFELTMLFVTLMVGLTVFRRLLDRRIRATEYLRAINRINRYFVDQDSTLRPYLYWPPCDDCPSLYAKGTMLGGLRDIVAALNSLFVGFASITAARTILPKSSYWTALAIGIMVGIAVGLIQHWLRKKVFGRADQMMKQFVLFPRTTVK